jgi:hypothetical protein
MGIQPSESPNWKTLFEAAVLELDPISVPERIKKARAAINARLKELQAADSCEEAFKLLEALNALDDLTRMQRAESS